MKMKDDLISRQDAIALMCKALHYNYEEGYAVTQMLALPSAERKKGKWITVFVEYPNKTEVISECPLCGQRFKDRTNYCPNCGAEMESDG